VGRKCDSSSGTVTANSHNKLLQSTVLLETEEHHDLGSLVWHQDGVNVCSCLKSFICGLVTSDGFSGLQGLLILHLMIFAHGVLSDTVYSKERIYVLQMRNPTSVMKFQN
jgi:hypothetical protein